MHSSANISKKLPDWTSQNTVSPKEQPEKTDMVTVLTAYNEQTGAVMVAMVQMQFGHLGLPFSFTMVVTAVEAALADTSQ